MGLRLGSLFSSLSFMFLPLLCMGMISPTIIQLLNMELKKTGKTAGTIYAVSTVGGITMTLLMGFYFLPEWGIRKSVLLSAILLGLMVILTVIISRKYKAVSAIGVFIIMILILGTAKSFSDVDKSVRYLYRSEGILGQLAVVETKTGERTRTMYINQVPQTVVNPDQLPASLWKYPHRLAMLASIKKENSKALMIGLGGGSIAMELHKMGFSVDAVELDRRVPELAAKYFGFKSDEIPVYIDDGRHFIRTTDKKYDLVIIDVLNGEVQPHHMFTTESFAEIKQILEPDGMLMINNQGFLLGERGLGARSVYKTLVESGYVVKYFFAGDVDHSADIHFIASPSDFEIFFDPSDKINACCKNYPVDYMALVISIEVMAEENKLDLSDAVILTDDKPALVALYNHANEVWRTNIIDNVLNNPNAPPVSLFH
jgi:predicted membrane-bound spermidine synthase